MQILPIIGPNDLLRRLAEHRTIGSAPRSEHEWLIANSEFRIYEAGEVAAVKGVEAPDLIVVFSGRIAVTLEQGSGTRHTMESLAGGVTGVLPYSRMTSPFADAVATERTEVLALDKSRVPDLTRHCPAITTRLVHVMLDRARRMTAANWQDEKTMSLGRLAAGLAHELNNPVSAASRSASLLRAELHAVGEAAGALGALLQGHRAERDVRDWIERVESRPAPERSSLERLDAEERLATWLEQRHLDSSSADILVAAGIEPEALDEVSRLADHTIVAAVVQRMAAYASVRALLADIERATARVHGLVSAVRRFAFLDRSLASEPTDIRTGLADTVAVWRARAEANRIAVEVSTAPDLPTITGNAGLLNQVWSNLLENALDAVPPGGRIQVSARREGGSIAVRFLDNGPGVTPDVMSRMFDPFFTTKAVGQGTGLGLDIARRVVQMHEGSIEVRSEPGWTEMTVSLPVRAEPDSRAVP